MTCYTAVHTRTGQAERAVTGRHIFSHSCLSHGTNIVGEHWKALHVLELKGAWKLILQRQTTSQQSMNKRASNAATTYRKMPDLDTTTQVSDSNQRLLSYPHVTVTVQSPQRNQNLRDVRFFTALFSALGDA